MIRIIVLLVLCTVIYTQGQIQALSQSDRDTMLAYHNGLRGNYGMPQLTWSTELETNASSYAAKCNFAHSCPGCGAYGENLYASGGTSTQAFPYKAYPVQMDGWKGEETYWTCSSSACATGAECRHLTAMIWKTTTKVGCGVAKCPVGTVFTSNPAQYLICQYTPAGNWDKQHPLVAPAAGPATICPSTIPTPAINTAGATPSGPSKPTPVPTPTKKPTPTPTPTSKKPTPTPTPTKKGPTAPVSPGTANWANCIGDYWPGGTQRLTNCKAAPTTIQGALYCDVGDPEGYFWPCYNCPPTSNDCPYYASAITDDQNAQKGILPMEAWIGIAVGIAVFIIIVIIIIIVVMKSKKDERV